MNKIKSLPNISFRCKYPIEKRLRWHPLHWKHCFPSFFIVVRSVNDNRKKSSMYTLEFSAQQTNIWWQNTLRLLLFAELLVSLTDIYLLPCRNQQFSQPVQVLSLSINSFVPRYLCVWNDYLPNTCILWQHPLHKATNPSLLAGMLYPD